MSQHVDYVHNVNFYTFHHNTERYVGCDSFYVSG